MDELSEEEKIPWPAPVRFNASCPSPSTLPKSSPALLASSFIWKTPIKGFKGLVAGEYDHLPEAAFYMVGNMDEAIEKAQKLAAEAA